MSVEDPRGMVGRAAMREFRTVADELAGCAVAMYAAFRPERGEFERKHDRSRVTRLDVDLEKAWRDIIRRRFPAHSIVGEEHGREWSDSDFCWYLDPVDGTEELTRGIPLYGFILALYYKGLPLLGTVGHPKLKLRATAEFGRGARVNGRRVAEFSKRRPTDVAIAIPAMEDFLRHRDESEAYLQLSRRFPNFRTYRTVYAHVAVLTGALEAAVEFDVAEWDVAATRLLVEEARGEFREFRRRIEPGGVIRLGVVFGAPEPVSIIHSLMSPGD